MKAVAQRFVWIVGLLCLLFGVAGLVAFSPVTVALSVTGWFLSRTSIRYLEEQKDIQAPSPDLQYWARTLMIRTFGLMITGVVIAAIMIALGVRFHFSVHEEALLTALMICAMIVVTKLTLPAFFASSWEVHGARERRTKVRSSMIFSRFIVRTVAVLIVTTSLVGTFAMLQSIRLGGPSYRHLALMARVVSYDAPQAIDQTIDQTIEGIFSPSETQTR